MKVFLLAIILSAFIQHAFSQKVKKTLVASKTAVAPKIDGVLDDKAWVNAPVATDFVELRPNAGTHETHEERTEVKVLYDNNAIYIGARMYEKDPTKIAREFATRDKIGNADFIGVLLDTYKDGINASGFFVTSTNGQYDAKYGPPNSDGNDEDPNWNAVWTSKVRIDEQGWTAEMRIPYSALRFAKKDVQTWGLNIIRKRQSLQKQLFWNEIDPKMNGFINQEGILTGMENLNPPLRLAFYPYFSTYINHYPYNTAGVKNTTNSVNGGMDVKYGINESFTLDLTLIPDFGQVQSDNKILNLTPFEVKYNENRPFFTEGTELFNKGNLFYSRRVGGQPLHHDDIALAAGETVIDNPTETKLINAIKLSGRTSKGLGIGLFNAITNTSYATVEDAQGNRRLVQTSPLSNYNILVFDQNLKNNSAVTLINTNVNRFGKDYSADVGGFVYNLNNKKNTYNLNGFAMMSSLYGSGTPTRTGYSYEVFGGKSSGNFTWNVGEDLVDSKYNPNDLGILNNNNFLDHNLNLQYTNYKPKHLFTQYGIWTNTYYSRRVNPSSYQYFNENFGGFGTFKNLWQANINAHYRLQGNDFYEPRKDGLVFKSPENFILNLNLNTNQSKRLSVGIFYSSKWLNNGYSGKGTDLEVFYNFRINNKLSFGEDVTVSPRINYTGFATLDNTDQQNPVFALRDVHTVENIFNFKYTLSSVMGLNLRLRHYWSKLNNKDFFSLAQAGALQPLLTNNFNHDVDQNYNIWNVDMIYVWQFTPGSELSVAWKNSAFNGTNPATQNYFHNLNDTINLPQNNNFSLKILYYVDYLALRRHGSKG